MSDRIFIQGYQVYSGAAGTAASSATNTTVPMGLQIQNVQSLNAPTSSVPPVTVKQEPVDPGYQVVLANGSQTAKSGSDKSKSDSPAASCSASPGIASLNQSISTGDASSKIRGILRKMIDNKGKELTVNNVIEEVLQKNEYVLSQSDPLKMKSSPPSMKKRDSQKDGQTSVAFPVSGNVVAKVSAKANGTSSGKGSETVGKVLRPKDPTNSCTIPKTDMAHIGHALVEMPVTGKASKKLFNVQGHEMICSVASQVKLLTPSGAALDIDLTCYWCNFCPFKSDKKDILLQHVMDHRFHCKFCTYQSFSRADVIHHCAAEHEHFQETAETLRYCSFLPDYLQVGIVQKKKMMEKRKMDVASESEPAAKKIKGDGDSTTKEEETDGEEKTDSGGKKEVKGENSTKTKEEDYDFFDMEVEEVEGYGFDDSDHDDNEQAESMDSSEKTSEAATAVTPVTTNADTKVLIAPSSVNALRTVAPVMYAQAPSQPMFMTTSGAAVTAQAVPAMPTTQVSAPTVTSGPVPSLLTYIPPATSAPVYVSQAGNVPIRPAIATNITSSVSVPAVTSSTMTPQASTSTTPSQSLKNPPVTVSSGLCWNCGYCKFVTLSQAFLKTHLNTQHGGKAHKYVAMLVSSQDEMSKIKQQDAELLRNPMGAIVPGITVTPMTSTNAPPPAPFVEIDNAEAPEGNKDKDYAPGDENKKYPPSFKCAHCNFTSTMASKVKSHLFSKHAGAVIYALDMRAVKLKQKRYLFFCHKAQCAFQTKETDEYIQHVEECTPWLNAADGDVPDPNDQSFTEMAKRSLTQTKNFVEKVAGKALSPAQGFKSLRNAEYACVYCSYVSNNNTRLKKHVLTNHKDQDMIIKDLQAVKTNKKQTVYFCKYCLWETRTDSKLDEHIQERHQDLKDKEQSRGTSDPSGDSSDNNTPLTTPSATPNPNSDNDDDDATEDLDLDIPEETVDHLLDAYITDEVANQANSGRPLREAAARAQIKARIQGQKPPLYRCLQCPHVCFGTNLMRKHMKTTHKTAALRVLDVKRKIAQTYAYICICPSDGCRFSSIQEATIISHANQEHGIEPDHTDILLLKEKFVPPAPTPAHPPAPSNPPAKSATKDSTPSSKTDQTYECLYCSSSHMFGSLEKMKEHLKTKHPSSELLFRDCLARKLRKTSRAYVCGQEGCLHVNTDQREHNLHMLAHSQSHIFECAKCQWFTTSTEDMRKHVKEDHKGEAVMTIAIDLDLDENGAVVKKVGGTVIKQEN